MRWILVGEAFVVGVLVGYGLGFKQGAAWGRDAQKSDDLHARMEEEVS